MPKISNTGLYPTDPNISASDYLIGTNGNQGESLRTQTFPILGVAAFIQEYINLVPENIQNNIGRVIEFEFVGEITLENLATTINALPSFTVATVDDMWFKGVVFSTDVNAQSPIAYIINLRLINVGKGTYGTGGTAITASNLQAISAIDLAASQIEDLDATVRINYGDITTPIEDWLNAESPSIDIQGQEDGYVLFMGTIDGIPRDYLWIAAAGTFGAADEQSTAVNFQLLANAAAVSPLVNTLQQVLTAGNVTTLPFVINNAASNASFTWGSVTVFDIATAEFARMDTNSFSIRGPGGFWAKLIADDPTANRTQTLQDKNGTIALLDDIPAKPYLVFTTQLVSQSGTSAPTIGTPLENTFTSAMVTSRSSAGNYHITNAEFIDPAKIVVFYNSADGYGGLGDWGMTNVTVSYSPIRIDIVTRKYTGFTGGTQTPTDGLMSIASLEIRYYL